MTTNQPMGGHCGKCLIHLPYKERNEYQCNNGNCPCHQPTSVRDEEIVRKAIKENEMLNPIWVLKALKQARTHQDTIAREGLKKWANDMRDKVERGEYCENEGKRWANGYDCAMYDVLKALSTNQ